MPIPTTVDEVDGPPLRGLQIATTAKNEDVTDPATRLLAAGSAASS